MRHNLCPGNVITFHGFPKLFDHFKNVGWDCLISFNDKSVYPSLIAEFYSHVEFSTDSSGLLKSITTCLQGQTYIIDEMFIVNALKLSSYTLDLPRVNSYLHPSGISVEECMLFKFNLSVVSDQMVPPVLFDFPCKIGLEFLTPECQFLGKILRQNFMHVRDDRKMLPFDLEIIKSLLNECMPYNLAYFLLTSFELCFQQNFLGFGLLLTKIFTFLDLPLNTHHSQHVPTSNIIAHLNLPPQPLIIFKPLDNEQLETTINLTSKLDSLNSMNQLLLHNQTLLLEKLEDTLLTLHTVKTIVCLLLEHNNMMLNPFNTGPDFTVPVPPPANTDENVPDLSHFSPLDLEDIQLYDAV